jgi:hypothetical protein
MMEFSRRSRPHRRRIFFGVGPQSNTCSASSGKSKALAHPASMKTGVTRESSRNVVWDAVDVMARGVLCRVRRARLSRTAKSCGPDDPMLVSRSRERSRVPTVARKPGSPGERDIRRKPSRREGRSHPAEPVVTAACTSFCMRAFPAPSSFKGDMLPTSTRARSAARPRRRVPLLGILKSARFLRSMAIADGFSYPPASSCERRGVPAKPRQRRRTGWEVSPRVPLSKMPPTRLLVRLRSRGATPPPLAHARGRRDRDRP